MAEEIQNLLEKIKRDGVEKANAEATVILEKAKADAKAIMEKAEADAKAITEKAEADAKDYAARAEETISQAARDTILKVEQSVTSLLTGLLAKNVNAALSDPAVVAPLVADAIRELVSDGKQAEIATNAKLAESLRAQLAATGSVKVITDDATQTGFSVRLDGGRVEHDFTGPTVAAALAARLREDLAKLVNP